MRTHKNFLDVIITLGLAPVHCTPCPFCYCSLFIDAVILCTEEVNIKITGGTSVSDQPCDYLLSSEERKPLGLTACEELHLYLIYS